MRRTICLAAMLLVSGSATWAADLTKIDRTIHHQPVYQSKSPRYGLLVFGPAAQTRVWVVVDGNTLLVDEMGKGDLREAKRVKLSEFGTWFKAGNIQVADKDTRYTSNGDWFYGAREHTLMVTFRTSAGWSYSAFPSLADHPLKAPVVHFGGPLTLTLWPHAPRSLQPGATVKLQPILGTPGLGDHAFARIRTIARIGERQPQVDIAFPAKGIAGAPIKLSARFSWCECCGGLDPSRVQVPAEAGQGHAKVTLSFPEWPEGKVAPAVFDVPVVKGQETSR